jgi:uncharacterized membrane protein
MAADPQDTTSTDIETAADPILAASSDEKRAAVIRLVQQIESIHLGPLPHPDALRAYAKLIPNGGERIMCLVESEAAHRHAQEARMVASETRGITRGQWMAFVLALLLAATGLYLGVTDHDWLAAGLFTTTIGAVVTVFVLGNKERADSRETAASAKEH